MSLVDRLSHLKILVLDVDGVLTDGQTWQDARGALRRVFSVRDTMGVRALKKGGLRVAVVTAVSAKEIQDHVASMEVDDFFESCADKGAMIEELSRRHGVQRQEIALMSADAQDLSLMKTLGAGFTVPSAPDVLRNAVHMVASKQGGDGAVLEVCNLILQQVLQNSNSGRAARTGRRSVG